MSRTRLTVAAVALALGATALSPAAATAPPTLVDRHPVRSLHAAAADLVTGPNAGAGRALRGALLRSAVGEDSPDDAPVDDGAGGFAAVYDAGDVDGDRRADVVVLRETGSTVRSGKDGRVLLRREQSHLIPVAAGAVRLVALDVTFREHANDGYGLEVQFQGLDRRGRALWTHRLSGSITESGVGPAYASRFQGVPAMLVPDQRDGAGAPAFLLGSLTGVAGPVGAASRLDLQLLSIADGTVAALPPVHGAGNAVPWAFAVDPAAGDRTCYATTAPAGPLTAVSLRCDGATRWNTAVDLRDPYVASAGDFDGDGASDLMLSTFGFEEPGQAESGRGTRVLSYAGGTRVGGSDRDGLTPLGGDASGDGQPDFLAFFFTGEGFGIAGVTLAGDELWRRTLALRGSGSLEGHLGVEVTGDGLADAFLRAEPAKGRSLAVVVNGRTGRALTVPDVDGLLLPGLRARGGDLTVLDDKRARVLSGDRARPLLDARLPGSTGSAPRGGAGAADVDRDGRRDLVLATRKGDRHVTTAVSSTGRVLWQVSERAPSAEPGGGVIVVG